MSQVERYRGGSGGNKMAGTLLVVALCVSPVVACVGLDVVKDGNIGTSDEDKQALFNTARLAALAFLEDGTRPDPDAFQTVHVSPATLTLDRLPYTEPFSRMKAHDTSVERRDVALQAERRTVIACAALALTEGSSPEDPTSKEAAKAWHVAESGKSPIDIASAYDIATTNCLTGLQDLAGKGADVRLPIVAPA